MKIVQIIEAEDWCAVFFDEDRESLMYVEPLACWGLVDDDGDRRVVGFGTGTAAVTAGLVDACEGYFNFVGYFKGNPLRDADVKESVKAAIKHNSLVEEAKQKRDLLARGLELLKTDTEETCEVLKVSVGDLAAVNAGVSGEELARSKALDELPAGAEVVRTVMLAKTGPSTRMLVYYREALDEH